MPAWEPRQRDPLSEARPCAATIAAKHPLEDVIRRIEQSEAAAVEKKDSLTAGKKEAAVVDPLSSSSAAIADPLGALGSAVGGLSLEAPVLIASGTNVLTSSETSRAADWRERRALILKQYAAVGQLRVNLDLLEGDSVAASKLGSNIDEAGPSGEKKVAILDNKTRGRLEQLEAAAAVEEGRTLRLTQTELVARVDRLNADLRAAWRAEERVRALKIAIQVSKMLGDTSFPTFFPTVFAVVAEILDSFGELVYERVHSKGTPPGKVLPPGFNPSDVAEEGKETTKNWFYKVSVGVRSNRRRPREPSRPSRRPPHDPRSPTRCHPRSHPPVNTPLCEHPADATRPAAGRWRRSASWCRASTSSCRSSAATGSSSPPPSSRRWSVASPR